MKQEAFDRRFAEQCTRAFAVSTGLGCTLSDHEGQLICECGFGCESCRLCSLGGFDQREKIETHLYGMTSAERFGGKYIYYCPMGLTCFTSPIVNDEGIQAKIIAGPFIMVDKDDFCEYELKELVGLSQETIEQAKTILEHVPYVEPERATQLSTMLFLAVGFLNNYSAESQMLMADRSGELQGQLSSYIMKLKQGAIPPYPFDTEHNLLQSIARLDQQEAQRLLNELLGSIMFSVGGDIEQIKSRIYELLVLISRTAVDNGADAAGLLRKTHEYRLAISGFTTIDALCCWLSDSMHEVMDSLFGFPNAKHLQAIRRCIQYIGANYAHRVTLKDLAAIVFLSPAYLSRIFKAETGVAFNDYLNQVRINKAKSLLRNRKIRLTDVALMVGYEDQSYFTRVFKRMTGMLPRDYRLKNTKIITNGPHKETNH